MLRLLIWLLFGISFRHRCNDEVISSERFESPWSQVKSKSDVSSSYSVTNIGPWWFAARVITVVRCKKCGRVRHISTASHAVEGISTEFSNKPVAVRAAKKEKQNSAEDSATDS